MFAGSNLKNFFLGSMRDRELRETRHAWDEAQAYWRASPLAQSDISDFAIDLMRKAADCAERRPADPILVSVGVAADALLRAESIGDVEPLWDRIDNDLAVAVGFREVIARRRRWSQGFDQHYRAFSRILLDNFDAVFRTLPESCFGDWDGDRNDTFDVVLLDLLDDPAAIIDRLFMVPYDDETFRLDIFKQLRELCASNMLIASGFRPDTNIRDVEHKLVRAPNQKNKTGAELADLYLSGSPFKELLELPVPFRIPEQVRYEHCHIVGGTGHGKTQLMQKMIHADLLASRDDERSVIVIDSQGDLINKLLRLDLFSPDRPDSLADRLILIDPADVEYPAALNLFDAHIDRAKGYSPADRERVLNGVIELYELFFGTFLGAELTQKQGVIFKYLARLMLAIPDATIHTLMRIMEDGKPFKPFMDQLDGSARYFFETEFFHPSFAATKKQVLRRLWGVLSTPAFERMFTQKRNKLDLFEAMNAGKIILVSTAKDLLKREGSQLLGRFMIAMVTQAALERSTLKEHMRRPCFVYVDEAQEYFDDSIETILNQARKYHVGLTLAHQTLDQLSPHLRSAMLSNTSMKCAGGVSAKDARTLADELRTTPAFIEGMKRRGPRSEFAVWVKQLTGQAIRLSVPLGFLERQPTLDEEEYECLVASNRRKYCGTLADVETLTPTVIRESASPSGLVVEPAAQSSASARLASEDDSDSADEAGAPEGQPLASGPACKDIQAAVHGNRGERTMAPTSQLSPPGQGNTSKDRHNSEFLENREHGKGGKQHRYLQSLVKELAEQAGLKATIEAQLATGGEVDVLLERDGPVAAIEISISTQAEHERANVLKCLRAQVPLVCVVVAKTRSLAKFEKEVLDGISQEDQTRVRFIAPEGIPDLIETVVPNQSQTETVVKGYRVRVSHAALSPEEASSRREALSRIVARSLREK